MFKFQLSRFPGTTADCNTQNGWYIFTKFGTLVNKNKSGTLLILSTSHLSNRHLSIQKAPPLAVPGLQKSTDSVTGAKKVHKTVPESVPGKAPVETQLLSCTLCTTGMMLYLFIQSHGELLVCDAGPGGTSFTRVTHQVQMNPLQNVFLSHAAWRGERKDNAVI